MNLEQYVMEAPRIKIDDGPCGLEWVKLRSWPNIGEQEIPSLIAADFFCGCGGLTLGVWEACRVQRRKLDIRSAIDVSIDALEVFRRNFESGEKIARHADITNLLPGNFGDPPLESEESMREEIGGLDLILAGPPCQGHSDLNNSTRRRDPRNALYLKVIRAIELFRPRAALIENVATIKHDKYGVVEKSKRFLHELGYAVSSLIVDASSIGLPQRRKRHLLLAVHEVEFDVGECFGPRSHGSVTLADYLSGLEDEPDEMSGLYHTPARMSTNNRERVAYLFDNDLYDLPNELRPPCHKKPHSYVSMYGRMRWDQPAQTITSGFGSMGQGRFIHPLRERTITPHEAARIQGFPDFYDFSVVKKRTALQEMIGNAVPPRMVALVIASLIENKIL